MASSRKVEIVSYNKTWPSVFEVEKNLISENLGDVITKIHHIGSTAIEGLAAKPIIDIMLEVASLDKLDECVGVFLDIGYEAKGENGIERRRFYQKGRHKRTHHIHAFQTGDEHIVRHLAFRDYISTHPSTKKQYEELKIQVAKICNNDIEKYCDGKDDFIKIHEAKALEWIKNKVK